MSTPTVGLVGSGPAIEAVEAALGDAAAEAVACDPDRVGVTDFAVVAGRAGADAFAAANASAREAGTPWLAVELGGVGGRALPGVDAAVSGFAPGTACYDCLRTRVRANLDTEEASDESDGTTHAGDETTHASDETTHTSDGTTDDDSAPGPASARFAGALAGREAATLLSGGESAVLGGVVELPHAERNLLAVPGCPACGDAAGADRYRELDREYADADLDDALARAEQAVDERVGPVSSVGEVESFPAPYYLATLADTAGFSDAAAADRAAGVAVDWNEALMKALGEGLERYAAGVYRESAFRVARPAALDDAVAPGAFVRPDDWSTPDPDDELAWVPAENLLTGEPVHLPAEFVHFPPPAVRHKPSITTGLGLGNSGVEALLSGLYEVLERDATMLAWYSTFDPLELSVGGDRSAGSDRVEGDQSSETDRFETLRARARAMDLDVTALLVTQDVDVPVVAAAVHREGEWPQFAVGSDADLDPDAAAASALAEALQNWTELRSMGRDDAADADGAIGRHADFPEPAREFVDAGTAVPGASVGPAEPPDGAAELDALLDRLADADLTAYAARLTPRDVGRLGFEAVRVVVPAAQPLFTGEPFFGTRAREVPPDLGFEFRPDRDHHPYP